MVYPDIQLHALDHNGPWTAEDYLALPDYLRRVELLDGELVVSPNPSFRHQGVSSRLWRILDDAAPPEWRAYEAVNIRLDEWRSLIPDLVVIRSAPGPVDDRVFGEAADVALVVEVVSPGSRPMDKAIKPRLYAEAGIPGYLRVEEWRLAAYTLREGAYVPAELADVVPFPVTIASEDLLPEAPR
jgi:Uma2 family endonuclease